MPAPSRQNLSYFQKENILFFLMNICYFAANSIYFGFLTMYLTSQGYSSVSCGVINTLISLISLIFQPIAGYLTDTFITIKKYLVLVSIGAIATTFLLPLTASTPILAGLSIMIVALFTCPSTYLADTWSVTLREDLPYIDYGKNRAGGSLGYCAMSVIAGFLIAPFGYELLFLLHMILFAIFIVVVLQIPSVPCRNAKKQPSAKSSDFSKDSSEESLGFGKAVSKLAHNPKYMIFLVSAVCYTISSRAFSFSLPYNVLHLDSGNDVMGVVMAFGAFCEMPMLFWISKGIRRFRLSNLYLVCCIIMLFRGIALATAFAIPMLFLSQACQGLSNAIFLAVSLEIVSRVVSIHIRTTAVTFLIGMTNGLGAIVGTFVSGILIDQIGVTSTAWVMAIPTAIGFLIYLLSVLTERKKSPETII